MINSQKKSATTEEISGLALALLSDNYFMDLLLLCEDHSKPYKRMRLRQALLTKKLVLRAAGKDEHVCLRRF